jgi:hypothetical protein
VRVWDVSPGYLNRGSLLGEHRELHGLHSILINGKDGYSRHPETRRWVGCLSGLIWRHAQLAAEMWLPGYVDRTPIPQTARRIRWPDAFVTSAAAQFALLGSKYRRRAPGRIALPRSAHELWAHHKYSVMARDQAAYRAFGRRVARVRKGADLSPLATDLVIVLRTPPPRASLVNALEHMWGYVSKIATADERKVAMASTRDLLRTTCMLAVRSNEPYLMASTALSDLAVYVVEEERRA